MWSDNVCAISISTNEAFKKRLLAKWAEYPDITDKIHLEIIDYEYRDILTPMEDYIVKAANETYSGKLVTVVIPEFIPERTSAKFLHNQTANLLRHRLRQYDSVVIIDVPYLVQG
jgi:hypothetical protein